MEPPAENAGAARSRLEGGMAVVDFYFGLGSRYSYLASTQLDAIAAETGASFDRLPLGSTRLVGERGRGPFVAMDGSGQYDWRYRRRDAEAWACVRAKHLGAVEPYARRLLAATFADDLSRVDRTFCIELAGRVGLGRPEFEAALDGQEARTEQDGILRRAMASGAFGFPTFVVGDQPFWGNDRLVLLRHHLRKLLGGDGGARRAGDREGAPSGA